MIFSWIVGECSNLSYLSRIFFHFIYDIKHRFACFHLHYYPSLFLQKLRIFGLKTRFSPQTRPHKPLRNFLWSRILSRSRSSELYETTAMCEIRPEVFFNRAFTSFYVRGLIPLRMAGVPRKKIMCFDGVRAKVCYRGGLSGIR